MPVLTNGSTGRAQCREHMGSRWVRDNPVTWLIGQQWLIVLVDHGADMAVMSEGAGLAGDGIRCQQGPSYKYFMSQAYSVTLKCHLEPTALVPELQHAH